MVQFKQKITTYLATFTSLLHSHKLSVKAVKYGYWKENQFIKQVMYRVCETRSVTIYNCITSKTIFINLF